MAVEQHRLLGIAAKATVDDQGHARSMRRDVHPVKGRRHLWAHGFAVAEDERPGVLPRAACAVRVRQITRTRRDRGACAGEHSCAGRPSGRDGHLHGRRRPALLVRPRESHQLRTVSTCDLIRGRPHPGPPIQTLTPRLGHHLRQEFAQAPTRRDRRQIRRGLRLRLGGVGAAEPEDPDTPKQDHRAEHHDDRKRLSTLPHATCHGPYTTARTGIRSTPTPGSSAEPGPSCEREPSRRPAPEGPSPEPAPGRSATRVPATASCQTNSTTATINGTSAIASTLA